MSISTLNAALMALAALPGCTVSLRNGVAFLGRLSSDAAARPGRYFIVLFRANFDPLVAFGINNLSADRRRDPVLNDK